MSYETPASLAVQCLLLYDSFPPHPIFHGLRARAVNGYPNLVLYFLNILICSSSIRLALVAGWICHIFDTILSRIAQDPVLPLGGIPHHVRICRLLWPHKALVRFSSSHQYRSIYAFKAARIVFIAIRTLHCSPVSASVRFPYLPPKICLRPRRVQMSAAI